MTLDEFEAIRLADLEGLYQEQAAERMEVSRATFGRIIEIAHRKVAEALIRGKALKIEGGPISPERLGSFRCPRCLLKWKGSHECPRCRTAGVCGDRSAGSAPGKNEQACRGRRVRRIGRKNT